MNNVYNKTTTPEVDRNEINIGLVCVAPCDGKWYRVQVSKLHNKSLLFKNYSHLQQNYALVMKGFEQ